MISDETKWKIERIVNTCGGVCEIGKLLHELWRAYTDLESYIKTHEIEAWADIQKELKLKEESDE
jgi:hypothetical protein